MLEALNPFMLRAVVGVFLASLTSMLGALTLLRGIAYLPAEASHSALGGAAVGVYLSAYAASWVDPFLVAALFSVATALATEYAGRRGGAEVMGAAIGGSLAAAMAIYAFVRGLVPGELKAVMDGYLIGDVLLLSSRDIMQLLAATILTLAFTLLFYNELIYICFDMDGAEALGLNVGLYDYLLFALAGMAGVVAAKSMGALLVYAFMIAPAASARELTNRVRDHLILTLIIALSSGLTGLAAASAFNLPASGTIAAIPSGMYIILLVLRRLR
ncbi:MAG: metal ABC transporter permease [Candidatus Bathyarchaeia archaeon]